jgi:hypothetical protein
MDSIVFDMDNFTAIDKNNVQMPIKLRYTRRCIREGCEKLYTQSLIQERNKKYPWHCKSCAISREWNENIVYREIHEKNLKLAAQSPENKKHCSEVSKRNWANPETRRRMSKWDRTESVKKGKQTLKQNILSGKTTYKITHGKKTRHSTGIYFRSTYEYRFANSLDKLSISWKYELPFELKSGKIYIVDFYLPELDLYAEIKGWWRDDALEKFNDFIYEYPQYNCILVMKNELELLERGQLDFNSCIKKTGWDL